jgi:cyclophilin family peptidyl-prolyl cis-trans isomerase
MADGSTNECVADKVARVRINFTVSSQRSVVLECHRAWAPASYDRFLQLVRAKFLDGQFFVRAIRGFVLDWNYGPTTGTRGGGSPFYEGLEWFKPAECEKRLGGTQQRNCVGAVSFGQEEDGTTKSEVFINLADNSDKLDGLGFWPFARVVECCGAAVEGTGSRKRKSAKPAWVKEIEDMINFEHGDVFFAGGANAEKAHIRQKVLIAGGNEYIARTYPNLTQIITAEVEEGG